MTTIKTNILNGVLTYTFVLCKRTQNQLVEEKSNDKNIMEIYGHKKISKYDRNFVFIFCI